MAEEKKTTTSSERAERPASKPAASLAPASESSDPAVHQLLAERQTAALNGDEDAAKAATARLAELGYQ